jgi:hypothetical protein
VISDKKYTLAVFYEDYIPVELDHGKTSPNDEGGASAILSDAGRGRKRTSK